MEKTADSCITRIFRDIERRRAVDHTNRNSVRRYHAAMERITKNMEYIDLHFPEQFYKLTALLDHPDSTVVFHCVSAMFRLTHCTQTHKKKIVDIAKRLQYDPSLPPDAKSSLVQSIPQWEAELTN